MAPPRRLEDGLPPGWCEQLLANVRDRAVLTPAPAHTAPPRIWDTIDCPTVVLHRDRGALCPDAIGAAVDTLLPSRSLALSANPAASEAESTGWASKPGAVPRCPGHIRPASR